jgi:hypothetical protein
VNASNSPEYAHPLFLKGQKQLLAEIKRKIPKSNDLKKGNEVLKKELESLRRKEQEKENKPTEETNGS